MNDLLNTLYDYVLTQSESYLAVYPSTATSAAGRRRRSGPCGQTCPRRRNSFWRTCWGNCGSGIRRSRRPFFQASLALCRS